MSNKPTFSATVTHRPGALRLDGFPLLVYAPEQWGDGVRTENNGTPVADIAAVYAGDFAETAARFGVTEDHARQAIAYCLANVAFRMVHPEHARNG